MKGCVLKTVHRRTQSQGKPQILINEDYISRDLNSQNKSMRFKGRDENFSAPNTPKRMTPLQQSFSSGFWNTSQPFSANKSNMYRTGLSFKQNQINEVKEIDQQKLTILQKTCAEQYGDIKKAKDSFINTTYISNQLNNRSPQLDYYSKNIITNQLLFKKIDIKSQNNSMTFPKKSTDSMKDIQLKSNHNFGQENKDQNEDLDHLKGFVKTLYCPSRKNNKSAHFSYAQNDSSYFTNSKQINSQTPSNNLTQYFQNTPKSIDFFVTKLNTVDFISQKYSTMLRDSAQNQIIHKRNKLENKNNQEFNKIQRSLQLYSRSEKRMSSQEQKKDGKQMKEIINKNNNNIQDEDILKYNQDSTINNIIIKPMHEVNPLAQTKILASFKKAKEIDPKICIQNLSSSFNQQKEQHTSQSTPTKKGENILEKYQVTYTDDQAYPNNYDNIQEQHKKEQIKLNKSQQIYKNNNQSLDSEKYQKIEHSFYCLFIFIDNLSNIKRKSNLKYKIIEIPRVYNQMSQNQVNQDFEELKQQLKHYIGLNLKYTFFFKQNGYPLLNHLKFTEIDYNNEAIFFGSLGQFSGIQNLACTEQNRSDLYKTISNLCMKVRVLNQSLQNNQKQNNQNTNKDTNIMQNTFQKYKILTKEEISQIKNKCLVNRIAQTLSFNPIAKVKILNNEEPTKAEMKYIQIEKQLQDSIKNTKKMIVEAPSNIERKPEKSDFHNLREVAKYIDEFLMTAEDKISKKEKQKQKKIKEESERYQQIEDLWNNCKQTTKTNYIRENIEKYNNTNSIMNKLQKKNKELFLQNIPKLLNKYDLSRHDLHSIYILYKALLNVSVQRTNYKEVFQKGIDFKTFELGVDRLSSQGEEIIQRMCNYNSFINWESFLQILSGIQGKSLESKVNIFIKVSDTDKSGNLSKEEIEELCNICLQKFIPKGDDTIVSQLTDYFTKLLFSSLDVDIDDSIPLQKLKDAIIGGHPESDLLCFFCGVN